MNSPSGTDRKQALGLSLMVRNRMRKPLVSGAIRFAYYYTNIMSTTLVLKNNNNKYGI